MTFTDSQKAAVTSTSPVVLVIAAAGSGKTHVLTHRLKHLLDHGASIADFLVLTFTRRAAAELKGRLRELLGDVRRARNPVDGLLIGTFHSVALSILRVDGEKLGYNSAELTVASDQDAQELLLQVCLEFGLARYRLVGDVKKLCWLKGLSWAKVLRFREHVYTTGGVAGFMEKPIEVLTRILAEYRTRLRNLNAMDFGSILLECQRLLDENPEVLTRWRGRVKHVMVDELQDTDEVQYTLHRAFAPPATFFGVGDRRQSIFGFRGARPDLMTKQHSGSEVIDLRECFRCKPPIVNAANALISVNADPLAKPMIAVREDTGGPVEYPMDTFDALVQQVRGAANLAQYRWEEIAIIARKHGTLKLIEHVLRAEGIPVHRVGSGFSVCDSTEFIQVHAAMRLCINQRDDLATLWLRGPLGLADDISATGYAALRSRAAAQGTSHFVAYEPLNDLGRALKSGDVSRETRVDDFLSRLTPGFSQIGDTGLAEDFWLQRCGDMSIVQAHYWYALSERDAQCDQLEGDHVTLCTIHAAKGLEWPYVIVAELNEGTFPLSRCVKDEEDLREERRVAYVAITRARDELDLHYLPPGTMVDQGWGPKECGDVSRFIGETQASTSEEARQ